MPPHIANKCEIKSKLSRETLNSLLKKPTNQQQEKSKAVVSKEMIYERKWILNRKTVNLNIFHYFFKKSFQLKKKI